MNICVIGASGKLGKSLMKLPDTVSCDVRFEHSHDFDKWFKEHPTIDTVWHVARACRKTGVRRDANTFILEFKAMQDLLKTRAKDCRLVYASTKTVYGITSEMTPLSADNVANYFTSPVEGVMNCPDWKPNKEENFEGLSAQHLVYAMTKLSCERLIKEKCRNYKILRIWDII
jgi:nucleoside-diphosphate-sugar epimerase|tara:strand:+ start:5384 stop:5902 length:519 start_codon:yes stop_codon:yes gene_type:complete